MTNPIQQAGIGQDQYMKLFLQELTYQDPLKPLDNKDFLVQMAQFSALQQAQETNESLSNLVAMTSANQSLFLLGKKVQINGSEGTVLNVKFKDNEPPMLTVSIGEGQVSEVNLTQISEVEA